MLIQILGAGAGRANCKKLAENAEAAAKALGVEYKLEKISDLKRIMGFGVMLTPALVVDGVVKVSGQVPSVDALKKMLA
jgi:small redox-active disulfide protein 2